MAARLGSLLVPKGQTIAIAETSAGGLISSSLLAVAGASKFFRGGVVCYSPQSKAALLGLKPKTPTATEAHALELALAARERLGADWGLGETGVAGPSQNSRGVNPGVCAIAVVGPNGYRKATMLWPDDTLSAADAYGQAPKVSRAERMRHFGVCAVQLAAEGAEAHFFQGK
jgi:PncC family amidohydrolase